MLGDVSDLERVTKVRLIATVLFNRLKEWNPWEWVLCHLAVATELGENIVQNRLQRCENVFLGDKAHFKVELIEFTW